MLRTYDEINEKIRNTEAVVVTAEELIELVEKQGIKQTAKEVDVVTTATFGPMCSSGALLNFGHSQPRMKIQKAFLNGVQAYAGLAAVDVYIGATEMPVHDPLNSYFPGEFKYGGGHVIQDLVAGKDIKLTAVSYGTDCYPRKKLESWINIKDLNEAVLLNPRNAYQNYNVAVNKYAKRTIYTYMGALKPNLGNANYCSAGQMSPLLKDPFYEVIGIGTHIWLGGGDGYVYWQGTQHNPTVGRTKKGIPKSGAGTMAVTGDLKKMKPEWLVGTSMRGYGATLTVGIGVPLPIISESVLEHAAVPDKGITTQVVDYSRDYPNNINNPLAEVNYEELKSGSIELDGKKVPTASLSSYPKAVEIATLLKKQIKAGEFLLTEPVKKIPSADSGLKFKPLKERPING
jgi:uncharacterized protein (DUF39 family)